jgi:hypothetical protein
VEDADDLDGSADQVIEDEIIVEAYDGALAQVG